MRFKAKLAHEQVSILHWIIGPMTRLPSSSTTAANGGNNNGSNNNHNISTILSNNNNNTNHYKSNTAILYFDNDFLRISCKGSDGITCFVELNATSSPSTTTSIFLDRRIESIAPNNAIVMEMDMIQFRVSLKSVLSSSSSTSTSSASASNNIDDAQRYVVMKLAKRQGIPCFCIDACSSNSNSTTNSNSCIIQVHHAIPVRILRHTEMQYHLPPPIAPTTPQVQLELCNNTNTDSYYQYHGNSPSSISIASNLRMVLDRLKSMSTTIIIEANTTFGTNDELSIVVPNTDNGGASIQTYFSSGSSSSKLKRQQQENDEDNNESEQTNNNNNKKKKIRMKVDTKKLAACLQWQSTSCSNTNNSTRFNGSSSSAISTTTTSNHHTTTTTTMVSSALLCLIENEMMVLHVNVIHNIGFFTYYIPVHYL